MKFRSARPSFFAWVQVLIAWLVALPAFAATTNSWTNTISGLWRIETNWSAGQPPNSSFGFILITNAGTKTVTVDAATPATNLIVPRLTLSAPAGFTNTLELANVSTNLPLQASGRVIVDRGGVLNLDNSKLSSPGLLIDNGGILTITNAVVRQSDPLANFDVFNGLAWLESGLLDCSGIPAIRLGRANTGVGTLVVNGGSALAYEVEVGTSSGAIFGPGNLILTSGTMNVASNFTAGFGVNATGTVSVAGGQLIVTNGICFIGKSGFGQLNLTSGEAELAFASVGNNANGQVAISGGQLTLKPRTTNDWFQIGDLGVGRLLLSGGVVRAGGEVHVGDDSSPFATGLGDAVITGGQFIATNDTTAIGRYGPGQMLVSNATVLLTNVSVGRHDGATGLLRIEQNAQVFMLDALSIARFSNSVGHVQMNGGLLSLTNDIIWVGREGSGDFTLSNGTARAKAAFVALSTIVPDPITAVLVTNLPRGELVLAGGSLNLTSNLWVGTSLLSTGQVLITGGSLSIGGGVTPGYVAVSSGSVTLDQGSLTADSLVLTNATGHFVFNGGTLQLKNAVVTNGEPFIVGDGIHPANLQLLGGTFSFNNGLVISSNASVTGCGFILGSINNLGTLSTNCASSGITITSASKSGNTATVFFSTMAGSNHVLEYKNTLADSVWTPILPGVIGDGTITNKIDPNATTASRFYRIHLQ